MTASKTSYSEFITVRGLRMHVRHWGQVGAPKLFMLHGWMDVGVSFQFVVDELKADWHVIAPDWRGFGLSQASGADAYWFPDYLGDLDAMLEYYSADQPVNLLGHSMGGNVAMLYAGIRPARVRRLINLDGMGMAQTSPGQAPARYARWLDELREDPQLRDYASIDEVADRLMRTNPRLPLDKARFLAQHWARSTADGRYALLADPIHKRSNAILYRQEEVFACWAAITAPVLWVEAEDQSAWHFIARGAALRAELDRRIAHVPDVHYLRIADSGHMLHHDQPAAVAHAIEDFLQG